MNSAIPLSLNGKVKASPQPSIPVSVVSRTNKKGFISDQLSSLKVG